MNPIMLINVDQVSVCVDNQPGLPIRLKMPPWLHHIEELDSRPPQETDY